MHGQAHSHEHSPVSAPEALAEEPVLTLTAKAIQMVREALEAEKLEGHGLRVFVQGGGCSGFQYGLDFDQAARAGDFELEFDGL